MMQVSMYGPVTATDLANVLRDLSYPMVVSSAIGAHGAMRITLENSALEPEEWVAESRRVRSNPKVCAVQLEVNFDGST